MTFGGPIRSLLHAPLRHELVAEEQISSPVEQLGAQLTSSPPPLQQRCPSGQSVKSSQENVQISQPALFDLHTAPPPASSQQTWVARSQIFPSQSTVCFCGGAVSAPASTGAPDEDDVDVPGSPDVVLPPELVDDVLPLSFFPEDVSSSSSSAGVSVEPLPFSSSNDGNKQPTKTSVAPSAARHCNAP